MSNNEGQGVAVLRRGFRPFFLLALAVGAALMVQWALMLSGLVSTVPAMPPALWHGHEMIFGYALAVVAGFLLTAVRHWTNRETPVGSSLAALAVLWVGGRVAMQLGHAPLVALLFPIALVWSVGRPIRASGSRRNYGVVVIVAALALLEGVTLFGRDSDTQRLALHGAMHLMILLIVVIGGRVIPLFTRNRLQLQTRVVQPLEIASLLSCGLAGLGLTLHTVLPGVVPALLVAVVSGASGLINLARMTGWRTTAAIRVPMLAVLHLGYGWVGVGHLLAAAAVAARSPLITPLHALTVGAIGTMTVGMLVRVSMGHTGREISIRPWAALAFISVTAATFARICADIVPAFTHLLWTVSATSFAIGLLAALVQVGPWLCMPRADA